MIAESLTTAVNRSRSSLTTAVNQARHSLTVAVNQVCRSSRSFDRKIELKRRERRICNPSSDLRNYSV
ncbi:hypothetical protein HC766_07175 [Candidatus Gracilibacteria bacterium]|nr:hypothetical protein [Candidatus Gracilibacteria bacterium]